LAKRLHLESSILQAFRILSTMTRPCKYGFALFLAASAVTGTRISGGDEPARSTCIGSQPERETSLIQIQASAALQTRSGNGVTSKCAERFPYKDHVNAACLIVEDRKVLLVYKAGWDLPGGWKHGDEVACETAERHTCEETGHQVTAVEQITHNVFRCKIEKFHACKDFVDNAVQQKHWWPRDQITNLAFRSSTWGDTKSIISRYFGGSASSPGQLFQHQFVPISSSQSGEAELDPCGCDVCRSEGFSSRFQRCSIGETSLRLELCACLLRKQPQLGLEGVDACGCKSCRGFGWSSSRGRCALGSTTSATEGCQCLQAKA